jgi:hypothetical protein
MSRAPTKTAILDDGLRYKAKVSGSPFGSSTLQTTSTMSCFMCGKHRSREFLARRTLFGKSQAVCTPSCKEVEAGSAKKEMAP